MTVSFVVGLDVGSTYVKGQLSDETARPMGPVRRPTPWRSLPDGRTEMAAADLGRVVREILGELAGQVRAAAVDARVTAIGVTGMAESGALLRGTADRAAPDPYRDDAVVRPIIAWFDTRGEQALTTLPAGFDVDFRRRTGLPFDPLASLAKLLTFRAEGLDLAGLQWLNVPELVAHSLGAGRHSERSLAGRTGLLDTDTAAPWPAVLEALGADATLVPPCLPAGAVWGRADDSVPEPMRDAAITVAGHDHVVASLAAGVHRADDLYASMGTAEALVRVLDTPLTADARDRLARRGVDVVPHVLPDRSVMLAGIRTGLVLRRVLQLVGVHDAVGRALLDEAVLALDELPAGLTVHGAANDDGTLSITAAADGLSPAALFAAALAHSSEALRDVLAVMESEVAPAHRTVVAGGWAQMRSVRAVRERDLPDVTWAPEELEGAAAGAALVAAFAADPSRTDLTDHLLALPTIPSPPTGGST